MQFRDEKKSHGGKKYLIDITHVDSNKKYTFSITRAHIILGTQKCLVTKNVWQI